MNPAFSAASANFSSKQPGFVAGGVGQFVERYRVIVIRPVEGFRAWQINVVQARRIIGALLVVINLDNQHPLYSYLRLARTGPAPDCDGRLEAQEFMEMSLDADNDNDNG